MFRMGYSADPHWSLVHDPGVLVLHAGADELFAIDDVSDGVAAEVLALWRTEVMHPERLSQEAADVFEQLKAAGIVYNLLAPRVEYALELRFAGRRDGELEAALVEALAPGIAVGGDGPADLVLFVRTDGALQDLVGDAYAMLAAPHLLLDVAFDHTICLGPLVFTGQTACLSCLVGRLSYYWGDVAPPPRPRMTGHPGLSAGLAAVVIENILLREDRSLVNRTVAYDLCAHETQSSSIYRLPTCRVCGSRDSERCGSMVLPWARVR